MDGVEVTIRPATDEDAQHIARIKVQGWAGTYSAWIERDVLLPFLDAERQAAAVRRAVADPENVVLVASIGAQPVGFAVCLVAPDTEPLLDSLHVAADARGSGVGTLLVREIARRLVGRGYTTLGVKVVQQNARARVLYERLGAAEAGEAPAVWAPAAVVETHLRWSDLDSLAAEAAGGPSRADLAPSRR